MFGYSRQYKNHRLPKGATMKSDNHPDKTDFLPAEEIGLKAIPAGVDRRTFLMRYAVIGSAAVIAGCSTSETEQKVAAAGAPAQQ